MARSTYTLKSSSRPCISNITAFPQCPSPCCHGNCSGRCRLAVVHVAPRGELSPLSQNAPVLLQHAGAWGVGRDDLFSVLLVNLQRDSGRSRGHPSERSGLQAISTAMRSTAELCMELGWGRLLLHQHEHSSSGTTGRESHLYRIYVYMSLSIYVGIGECVARGKPTGGMQQDAL